MALLKSMGCNPTGSRLSRIKNSPNYRNGAFQNIELTEMTIPKSVLPKMIWKFINKPKGTLPSQNIPVVKTYLKNLDANNTSGNLSAGLVTIWFGHSSYLIKSKSFTVLVDPVFSGYTSPFRGIGKSFKGADVYSVDDFPEIDLLVITHDHYDHLDFETILKLKTKVKKVVTSLGVGEHLEYWGYDINNIIELDWWESAFIRNDINITATPARHFSGRTFNRNQTLWSSFVLSIHGYNIFIGGDSGFSNQFKIIGDKFGPFDLAFLDGAQYNDLWAKIHMRPEETLQAAKDLQAKKLFPVHWGKFAMAYHAWDEPINRLMNASKNFDIEIITPKIGEPYFLNSAKPALNLPNVSFNQWWLGDERNNELNATKFSQTE